MFLCKGFVQVYVLVNRRSCLPTVIKKGCVRVRGHILPRYFIELFSPYFIPS